MCERKNGEEMCKKKRQTRYLYVHEKNWFYEWFFHRFFNEKNCFFSRLVSVVSGVLKLAQMKKPTNPIFLPKRQMNHFRKWPFLGCDVEN